MVSVGVTGVAVVVGLTLVMRVVVDGAMLRLLRAVHVAVGRPGGLCGSFSLAVAVAMAVALPAAQGNRHPIGLAGAGAFAFAQCAGFDQPLDMVVVTPLRITHLRFEAQHLRPVLTERTVHLGVPAHHFFHTFMEGVDHQWMVTEIRSLHEVHGGMICRHTLTVQPDAAHQYAGKRK